jgi:hypothetical protein
MNPSKYAWRVVVSMRISKDSSRFFTVEAVALQNLPQTLRGRERSKRGYATPLLPTATASATVHALSVCDAQDLSLKTPEAPETRLDQPLTTRAAHVL